MIDITVSNLVKSFEIGNPVLDGLSFSVESGERVAILGPNGCGKTTLFRILTGALDYDEGQVSVAPGKRIGLISQIPVFPEGWTAEDVLRHAFRDVEAVHAKMETVARQMETDDSPALLREYDRLAAEYERRGGYEADVKLNRIANGLQIGPAMRAQSFVSLSGGEQTRLNLARLILEDTEILLLDEPTNHLDLVYQKQIFSLISQWLTQPGKAVISVVHDLSLARACGTRAILLDGGRQAAAGSLEEVFSPEHLDRVYSMDVAAWMRGLLSLWN